MNCIAVGTDGIDFSSFLVISPNRLFIDQVSRHNRKPKLQSQTPHVLSRGMTEILPTFDSDNCTLLSW